MSTTTSNVRDTALVIGAGFGGLSAAIDLARAGVEVEVVEKEQVPGGKAHAHRLRGYSVEGGPTVLTMADVFERLFDDAGASLRDHVEIRPSRLLARHHWTDGSTLDLFADTDLSASAIADLCGRDEADRFRRFRESAAGLLRAVEPIMIRGPRPSWADAIRLGPALLWGYDPFRSLWTALGSTFRDPRLRQLFGRYATYVGSSPFASPGTLAVIAAVELEGVWTVQGGLSALAGAMASLAERLGVRFHYGTPVRDLIVEGGRVRGVRVDDGEIRADHVVANTEAAALVEGLLGEPARRALPAAPERSLSALTWAMVAEATGFDLAHHTVFFSADYPAEFEDLFGRSALPADPTVYVCAQDRLPGDPEIRPERLLVLVNAPARDVGPTEIDACERRTFERLSRSGLTIRPLDGATARTGPSEWARRFPASRGSLYGAPSHGWAAPFRRPAARTALPGLYLAGGSAHPGAGTPMATLSGRLAARAVLEDLDSTSTSRRAATPGGTSTSSPTMEDTRSR